MKKKIKELTIGKIVAIADKYDKCCEKCPLFKTDFPCTLYCDDNECYKMDLKESLEDEVEIEDE